VGRTELEGSRGEKARRIQTERIVPSAQSNPGVQAGIPAEQGIQLRGGFFSGS